MKGAIENRDGRQNESVGRPCMVENYGFLRHVSTKGNSKNNCFVFFLVSRSAGQLGSLFHSHIEYWRPCKWCRSQVEGF